jgi:hypothetical protein
VELVSVETAAKRVSVQDLTSAVNPKKRRGRILDVLELWPDGSFRDLELKTDSALLRAYGGRFDPARGWRFSTRGPRGGVEITEFIPSDVLSKELEKTRVVFDHPKRTGGNVRVRGVALDGVTTVELLLDPADFAGTVPARALLRPQDVDDVRSGGLEAHDDPEVFMCGLPPGTRLPTFPRTEAEGAKP